MADKLISIITCTLNSEQYLSDCLMSIRNQSYKNYEVIIVDGGSVDKTLEIAEQFNVSKICKNIGGGVSNAMNHGIAEAKGEIISILHSDDYFANESVLKLVHDKFNSSSRKWLYGKMKSRKGEIETEQQFSIVYSYRRLQYQFFIPHPTVFVRSEIYKELGGFNTSFKYAMDYDLVLRFGAKYEPIQLDECLAVFREHESSLSTKNWFKAQYEAYQIQQKFAVSNILRIKGTYLFIKNRFRRVVTDFVNL